MKTQIQNLINGAKNIIRNEADEKYTTAKPATSHIGYAGTNREERERIAAAVIAENPGSLEIEARGLTLSLHKRTSVSGKTITYETALTEDEYKILVGVSSLPGTLERSFSLCINNDMTVRVDRFSRKSPNAMWKLKEYIYLDEAFIVIK